MRIINLYKKSFFKCLFLSILILGISSCNNEPSFEHIKYRLFSIDNYQDANFFVPNYEKAKANCERFSMDALEFQKDLKNPNDFENAIDECKTKPKICSNLELIGRVSRKLKWGVLRNPLLTMEKWHNLFPSVPIKVNTSFYEVEYLGGWPHKMPCTNLYGLVKSSDGNLIGNRAKGLPLDYLIINKEPVNNKKISFVSHKNLTDEKIGNAEEILSGFLLLKDGNFVFDPDQLKKNPIFKNLGWCNKRAGRMLLGVEGTKLFILHITNDNKDEFGATCKEAAELALSLGITDLINFDGGGSASFLVRDLSKNNINIDSSIPDKQGPRPIPGFLGITPNKGSDFSFEKDSWPNKN